MVNTWSKLYFINNMYKILLYTNASDYAHGAYLFQIKPSTETSAEIEEPIRFLSGTFSGENKMVHCRGGSFRDILGAKEAGPLTRQDSVYNIDESPQPTVHEQSWIQEGPTVEAGHPALQRNDGARPKIY